MTPLPSSFDWFIEEEEAVQLSAALADYLCNRVTWRKCRDKVMSAYPVSKTSRRERFAEVMAGLRDYSAEELDGELLDLHETFSLLMGSRLNSTDSFLEDLRAKAKSLHDKNAY